MENEQIQKNDTVDGLEQQEQNQESKTYTEEEVQDAINKAVQKRIARERKDIESKIEQERKEAEELARMSEEEKQKKLFEKEKAEFEEVKRLFEQEKLLNETSSQLASKNLPVSFAKMLRGADAESTFENIKVFESEFNKALENAVNERLKGNSPKAKAEGNNIANPYAKETYSLTKQMELEMNNPELAKQLRNAVK